MPLQRDLPRVQDFIEQPNSMAKTVEDYAGRKQRESSAARPQTPPVDDHIKTREQSNTLNVSRLTRDESSSSVYESRPANLLQKNLNGFKMQNGNRNNSPASFKLPVNKSFPPPNPTQSTKPAVQNGNGSDDRQVRGFPAAIPAASHATKSAFDDTASIDISELDYTNTDDAENETQIFQPLPHYSESRENLSNHLAEDSYHAASIENGANARASHEIRQILKSNGHAQREDERQRVGNSHFSLENHKPDHQRHPSLDAPVQQGRRTKTVNELEQDPDTPSRTAPIAPRSFGALKINGNKAVAFADSPILRGAEFAREESPELPGPRSAKDQMKTLSVRLQPKIAALRSEISTSEMRQPTAEPNFNLVPNRFQQKKPTTEPENPPEIAPTHEVPVIANAGNPLAEYLNGPSQDDTTQKSLSNHGQVSRKRPCDELDYDTADLKRKTLHELQSESFDQDPREEKQTAPVDDQGNALTLDRILTKLNEMDSSQQEALFRSQSDEEWSQTGAWFVEKFQSELKRLMEVRLERRKLALNFEDQIRRRQAEVEQHAAGVDKELASLQQGGQELVKDRKPASRCATPMRPISG